jgi:1-acyl-sn-glycerol-3-phosphate acyltransferase
MRRFFQVTVSLGWKARIYNRQFEPTRGGAVYICNHQSFLDPILMSFSLRRPMSYMARDTLFHIPLFKQVITALNAFPVRRGTADTGALKEAMRRLKAGGQLVVFAEGTRTLDGRIGPFLPGVALLAQRSAEWTVPVVIDGAYEAWPRTQKLPSPGSIVVRYAPPIHRDEARKMDAETFINHVRNVLIEMQADVRRRAGRPALKY